MVNKIHCNKKKILIIISIMLLIFTFFSCIPQAFAAPEDEARKQYDTWRQDLVDLGGGFLGVAYDFATTAAGCNPDFSITAMASGLYKLSRFTAEKDDGRWTITTSGKVQYTSGTKITLLGVASGMYEYLKVAGIALILLYFLIEIMDEIQADNFNVEHLVKKLITLAVAIIVMQQGAQIFTYIGELGDALIDDVNSANTIGNTKAGEIYQDIYKQASGDGGFFSGIKAALVAIGVVIENAVVYILMWVAWIIAYLTAFSRFLEILVRFVFAPIGIAQLVSGGSKGPGMRYIKKFASACLQGAVCVMSFSAVSILQNQTGIESMFSQILLPITLMGFLSKTGRIADDIVGV